MSLEKVRYFAMVYRQLGFAPCRLNRNDKRPKYKHWPRRPMEPKQYRRGHNIGLIAGPVSSGNWPGHALVAIDLDSEAAWRRADEFLPFTAMVEGRASKPRSHRYYLVPLDSIPPDHQSGVRHENQTAPWCLETFKHRGPGQRVYRDKGTWREAFKLVGTGGQTACPPSLHPEGEPREWDTPDGLPGEPRRLRFTELVDALDRLAEATGATLDGVGAKHAAQTRPPASAPAQNGNSTHKALGAGGVRGGCADAAGAGGEAGAGAGQAEQRKAIWQRVRASHPTALWECILGTQPAGPEQRYECLKRFVRRLKDHLPEDESEVHLRQLVRDWWALAYDSVRTKDYGTTERDFLHHWRTINTPMSSSRVLMQLAWGASRRGTRKERLLSGCRLMLEEIQKADPKAEEFYLSKRTAGYALACSDGTARAVLKELEKDGYLQVVRRGQSGGRKRRATAYRLGPAAGGQP